MTLTYTQEYVFSEDYTADNAACSTFDQFSYAEVLALRASLALVNRFMACCNLAYYIDSEVEIYINDTLINLSENLKHRKEYQEQFSGYGPYSAKTKAFEACNYIDSLFKFTEEQRKYYDNALEESFKENRERDKAYEAKQAMDRWRAEFDRNRMLNALAGFSHKL
jgi:hypothetical protein